MGACHARLSAEEKIDQARSDQIEADLRNMRKVERQSRKVILLGNDEAGKSTLFRQNKILFGRGISSKDIHHVKSVIASDVVASMRELARSVEISALNDDEVRNSCIHFSTSEEPLFPQFIEEETAEHIKVLWSSPIIRRCFVERNVRRLDIQDNSQYFFDEIDRIRGPDYRPSEKDVLHARLTSSAVVDMTIHYRDHEIILLDVGGQRNERKKWIHHFDRCHAILFIAAISEFDQVLYEDPDTNRLQESLDIFAEICKLPFFQRTHIILFLNKKDILLEKLQTGMDPRVLCPQLFHDFQGQLGYDEVVEYIVDLFAMRNEVPDRNIFCHVTSATDPDNIRAVFDIVYDFLLTDKSLDEVE